MFHLYLLYRATQHEKKRHKILYKISSKYVLLSKKYVGKFEYLVSDENLIKLCFIPNPTNFDLLKAEGGISKKKKTIIFFGRLDNPQKGIDRLMKIWEAVFFEHPSWELLIIGDGPDRKILEEYVSAKGIQRVNFLGRQSSVLTFYKNASMI
jgi:glycosyltransferase involved in cell wall biosynthesis